jgi:hypothetical protein
MTGRTGRHLLVAAALAAATLSRGTRAQAGIVT